MVEVDDTSGSSAVYHRPGSPQRSHSGTGRDPSVGAGRKVTVYIFAKSMIEPIVKYSSTID